MGAVDAAAFGRRVAEAQGYDPRDPSVNWSAYGHEAEYRIGRKQGVPDPARFRQPSLPRGGASPRSAKPAAKGASSLTPRRAVRIGVFEFAVVRSSEAPNRPRHHRHPKQRTTGRARVRISHAAMPHEHSHGRR